MNDNGALCPVVHDFSELRLEISPHLQPSFMTSGSVVVLCAGWCGVCREFKDPFEELGRALPDWRFGWVDIEAHAATEDVELESLPSLIVTGPDGKVIFLGPVVPRPSTVDQLLRGLKNHSPLALSQADALWINAVIETIRDTHG